MKSAMEPTSRVLSALAMARTRQLLPESARLGMDLMCLAGLRMHEVDTLRWSDVDLDSVTITTEGGDTYTTIGHLLECALEATDERTQPKPAALVAGPGWARAYGHAAAACGVLARSDRHPQLLRRTFAAAVGWHPGIWGADGLTRVTLGQHAAEHPDRVAALNDRIASARRRVDQDSQKEAP